MEYAMNLTTALLAVAFAQTASPQVDVSTLKGESHQGALEGLSAEAVSLKSGESMVEVLLEFTGSRGQADIDVLFAGGVHDGLSAAMVSTIAAPLVEKGVRVGVLAGTAYLFTQEAVASGAIQQAFQTAAVGCEATVTLEATPGYATRALPSRSSREPATTSSRSGSCSSPSAPPSRLAWRRKTFSPPSRRRADS